MRYRRECEGFPIQIPDKRVLVPSGVGHQRRLDNPVHAQHATSASASASSASFIPQSNKPNALNEFPKLTAASSSTELKLAHEPLSSSSRRLPITELILEPNHSNTSSSLDHSRPTTRIDIKGLLNASPTGPAEDDNSRSAQNCTGSFKDGK